MTTSAHMGGGGGHLSRGNKNAFFLQSAIDNLSYFV